MIIRDAATVILLRDGPAGVEVLMVRRHIRSDFVGGAYVFPGGALDRGDAEGSRFCTGLDDGTASEMLGVATGGLAWWYAAARECFEEAGLLLAAAVRSPAAARLPEYRRRIQAGTMSLAELLAAEDLRIAADRIHYWAHWITPEGPPRRFDTRFFLAVAPEGQTPRHDGLELTDSQWVTPAQALDRGRNGAWTLVLPTVRNLAALTQYRTAHDAEVAAREKGHVPTIAPVPIRDGSGTRYVIPGEESDGGSDYP